MTQSKKSPRPSVKEQADLQREWDLLAEVRHRQITEGQDTSYNQVIVPALLSLVGADADGTTVLDVGCGTGDLSCRLSSKARKVLGVDPSAKSIAIARKTSRRLRNVEFRCSTVENLAVQSGSAQAALAVANMTLMDCLDLGGALIAIAQLLEAPGVLVFTITHPWFWPKYWRYDSEDWFTYSDTITIEAPFKIGAEETGLVSTHIHRPLQLYFAELARAGFVVESLLEPMPNPEELKPWAYPRYLAVRALFGAERGRRGPR